MSELARLVAIGPRGELWITCADGRRARARATIVLEPTSVGRDVLVCYPDRGQTPVVVGLLVDPGDAPGVSGNAPNTLDSLRVDAQFDRERIVLSARQEVVIACGGASIRLTSDGKVVLRGTDVVSSASQVNRIRGGAVKVN